MFISHRDRQTRSFRTLIVMKNPAAKIPRIFMRLFRHKELSNIIVLAHAPEHIVNIRSLEMISCLDQKLCLHTRKLYIRVDSNIIEIFVIICKSRNTIF